MDSLHLIISGFVQGVGFRYFTYRRARELNLAGFVRNLPTGQVEVEATGEQKALKALEEYVKIGPPSARVQQIEEIHEASGHVFSDFEIL